MRKMAMVLAGILAAGAVYAADATTNAGIVTNAKGKIEWRSTVIQNDLEKKGTSTTTVVNVDSTNAYEPMAQAELSGTLFNTLDAKLVMRANKDGDACYLELSKTIGDTYVKWNSDLALNESTLFRALIKNGSLTVKKIMQETEGQVKAVVSGDKMAVDTGSSDTYIKWTPGAGDLSLIFRPYDIEWKIGDEFENENFDKSYKKGTDKYAFFENDNAGVNPSEGGLEVEYKLGDSGKIFGAFSGYINQNIKYDVTNGEEKNTTKVWSKVGVEIKSEDTKVVPAILFGVDSRKVENKGNVSGAKEDTDSTYFALNIDAETKMDTLKLEGELDLRSYGYEEKEGTKVKETAAQFGIMGKVSVLMDDLTPYLKAKISSTGYEKDTGSIKNSDASSNKLELSLGADKKIEALTLNAEFSMYTGKKEEKIPSTSKTETSGFGLGVKATYEF